MLPTHTKAPDFSLLDQNKETHTLSQYLGKWVVLYFYPKDDTPGCTQEACDFRDAFHTLLKQDVIVLGVSKDTPGSHKKFATKFDLPFPLLADTTKEMMTSYDVLSEKKFLGKAYMGIDRSTYLIDPTGMIVKAYENVDPVDHAKVILEDLRRLQSE